MEKEYLFWIKQKAKKTQNKQKKKTKQPKTSKKKSPKPQTKNPHIKTKSLSSGWNKKDNFCSPPPILRKVAESTDLSKSEFAAEILTYTLDSFDFIEKKVLF